MTILAIENVTLRLAGTTEPILKEMTYDIAHGDFIILLGSNGSGKSTLLKLLHRHYQPDTGNIHFMGQPLAHARVKTFSRHVRVLTQNCADSLFSALTIYENYLLIKETHPKHRDFLTQYLTHYNANLANKLDVTIDQLSGGEKQALALAFCLLHPPSLLLLDEHTSALDPKTSEQIMQLTQKMIAQHHITCILTTHDLEIALNYGNRILMLHEGRILKTFDTAAKTALSKEALVAWYYTADK